MKHDRSRRNRRPADPSVIYLPSQLPPYTPPQKPRDLTGVMSGQDDAELLAHKNIFDVQPRMSRQARRKALRAEKKAARRAETERFLIGAPCMADAASGLFETGPEPAWIEAPAQEAEHEVAAAIIADLLATEQPDPIAAAAPDPAYDAGEIDAVEEEPASMEALAQLISATGPLIIGHGQPATERAALAERDIYGPLLPSAINRAAPEPDEGTPLFGAAKARAEHMATVSTADAIEATIPLPRNRALVPHRRPWLLRLMPWLRVQRTTAQAPAIAQLQDLRFELATALRKLDQIIEQTA